MNRIISVCQLLVIFLPLFSGTNFFWASNSYGANDLLLEVKRPNSTVQIDLIETVNIGFMNATGQGVKQDFTKAIEYFEQAANLFFAPALFNLGVMYERGQGVKQDYAKAIQYYESAAKQDYVPAVFNLGLSYTSGQQ